MKLETIIGLELHVQLKTKTKMFCSCSNAEADQPNKNICPICLGHPGVLPTINQEAASMAIRVALALNCKIANFTKFDRKNYFYPDLPKGYQISQYDKPIAEHGWIAINNKAKDALSGRLDKEDELKRIGIIRLHMEEDSAKSTHSDKDSLIDYNRGGTPLIEIVTAPHFSTPGEAKAFAQELRLIMRHLEISDADMEKGHLRCDANISLRPEGDSNLYPKAEIKNINSFRSIERAMAHEIERQTILWRENNPPTTEETRGWDDAKGQTVSQRTKEQEHDYRYFPEPDLPPLTFTEKQIDEFKAEQHELPQDKRRRFMDMYGFTGEESKILTEEKKLSFYVEQIISELKDWLHSLEGIEGTEEEIWNRNKKKIIKLVTGWIINKFLPLLDELKIPLTKNKITAENFAEFITLIYQNKVNSAAAQMILKQMAKTGADPSHVMDDFDLSQISSEKDLASIIQKVIKDNPEQVEQFKAGKETVLKYFVGLVMRETKGKADPKKTEKLLKDKL
ncbi:Asp-tRNA(Asn)/Glu-tRNA(Gln) amidotransferase subunit GatB [Candidatus Falkowbacteria bacterium]|jgi:aspartyl-tRNA(Asn)/glutamyl-tRNA(Gln) amidotransferase subunit B|nr:Asp-tRNA(Asn)/Glu-tRNA(Gln) amidotransferase subunit GatB [Candidatus Falkowbacteria bacterium]MBT5503554.1 Asp-tRNA(Asn)/Glu-tRNA(Gln) amidotransferase subunit GatB [Candidatus Falkowbacteria bacterium]MBT6573591.1 Asp-tRNA(Asn)/Glu-tRNA(Gln) amidotransferase subunit GatB [Candidatus Falkowbacteria bacterium]MBT7348399.1 Asp-tRNA(Asn)/Glu-tRNA(Gln) amidotransferase subunit GatB [Candidatus Falkowbacteria bacterium]MBT7500647.1 Asp-tRNA(Asn)/Glu-tRNA(Gln) amidotransferase subunit GatB [Candi